MEIPDADLDGCPFLLQGQGIEKLGRRSKRIDAPVGGFPANERVPATFHEAHDSGMIKPWSRIETRWGARQQENGLKL